MRRQSALRLVNLLLATACLVFGAAYFASSRAQDRFWSTGTSLALAALLLFNAWTQRRTAGPACFWLLLAVGLLQVYVFVLKLGA